MIALIRAAGRTAVALPADIRTEAVCRQLVEAAVTGLGSLDLLVNNAAFQHTVPLIEDLDSAQFDRTFKTSVYAPFWITKAALAHLPRGASIINTASIQAYDSSECLIDYAQTKACNVAFTHALAKQLAGRGIRVNAVAPGPFWTPLQPSGGQPPDKLPDFGSKTPLGRPGQPAEAAAVYVLLACADAGYTTGEVYGVGGGNART